MTPVSNTQPASSFTAGTTAPPQPTHAASSNPPRAPLVLRVGVTGHLPDPKKRPDPNVPALRATITTVLKYMLDAVDGVVQTRAKEFDGSKVVRVISALAHGADQWVADEALKLGYTLQCPLPFSRDEYARDFTDATEYRRLLEASTGTLELDGEVQTDAHGNRQPQWTAYEAVGRAVLNQSDILLAVWDGLPGDPGGTGFVVSEALRRGIPVVAVRWAAPASWMLKLPEWRLISQPAEIEGDAERLKQQVRDLVLPPDNDTSKTTRSQYFTEPWPRGNPLLGWWDLFLAVGSGQFFRHAKTASAVLSGRGFKIGRFSEVTHAEWDAEAKALGDSAVLRDINEQYLPHYAWANKLSVYYANLYRSAFVVSYSLAALAVLLALFPPASGVGHNAELAFAAVEFAAILSILVITWYGRKRKWHERWIDYRSLAERLRLARALALFGGGGQQVSLAAHLATYGNPAATWMHWHYRMIERAAGLRDVCFSAAYLQTIRRFWLENVIDDQIKYHTATKERYHHLEKVLQGFGALLFLVTLLACTLHFFERFSAFEHWGTLLTAFLPALAAAFAGIRTQAELQRVSRRSQAMEESLKQMKVDLAAIPVRGCEGNSAKLRSGVDRVTELMVKEALDWRVVFLDRPLETEV